VVRAVVFFNVPAEREATCQASGPLGHSGARRVEDAKRQNVYLPEQIRYWTSGKLFLDITLWSHIGHQLFRFGYCPTERPFDSIISIAGAENGVGLCHPWRQSFRL
jgi:hypothetical protein